MSRLVLGPLLRHVDETTAAVWVETAAPCQVKVTLTGERAAGSDTTTLRSATDRTAENSTTKNRTATSDTFTVHGHHYAVVDIDGLTAAASWTYTVDVDGRQAWPDPAAEPEFPASRIRPVDPAAPLRLLFGSCRTSLPHDAAHERTHGPDALRDYARDLAATLRGAPGVAWPTALLLLGDQVYADEPSAQMREYLRAHRDTSEPPGEEVLSFTEYAELYRQAWSEPAIRWLLSTVPTAMIFDDHDLRDDWNTSHVWRERMARQPWWDQRVRAGLGSYWVYQHLGNMSPAERAADPVYAAVRRADRDGGEALDAFAGGADAAPATYRWSYHRDLGTTRLIMLDSRCARVLDPPRRAMLDDTEWAWFDSVATGGRDHVVIGTSLPYLLPAAIHHLESGNEAVCAGAWGRRAARAAERLRQALDLEHWAAFGDSFAAVARVLTEVAAGARGPAPASVVLLSGDVHYSYLAEAQLAGAVSAVHQVVCSPIRNPLGRSLRLANIVASWLVTALPVQLFARWAGVRRPSLRWRLRAGPWFRNALGCLDITGDKAGVAWLRSGRHGNGDDRLQKTDHYPLTR